METLKQRTQRFRTKKVLNLNCLDKGQWEYVMAILRKKGKPMEMQEILDTIFMDDSVQPGFKALVMVKILNAPASEMRG